MYKLAISFNATDIIVDRKMNAILYDIIKRYTILNLIFILLSLSYNVVVVVFVTKIENKILTKSVASETQGRFKITRNYTVRCFKRLE